MTTDAIKTLNLQLTCNLGNYESIKIGMEWTPAPGRSIHDEMLEADELLRNEARQLVEARQQSAKVAPAPAPAPAQNDGRTVLTADNPAEIQKLVNRIEDGATGKKSPITMETIEQYYNMDAEARAIIETAFSVQETLR